MSTFIHISATKHWSYWEQKKIIYKENITILNPLLVQKTKFKFVTNLMIKNEFNAFVKMLLEGNKCINSCLCLEKKKTL